MKPLFFIFIVLTLFSLPGCSPSPEEAAQNEQTIIPYQEETVFEKRLKISSEIADNFKKEAEDILSDSSTPLKEKTDKVYSLIEDIESRSLNRIQNSDSFSLDNIENLFTQEDGQTMVYSIERSVYKATKDFLKKNIIQSEENNLKNNLEALFQQTESMKNQEGSLAKLSLSSDDLVDLHDQEIDDSVREILKSKYSRAELAILEDKELTKPQEELYQFQSSASGFLEKNKKLYQTLRQANPFHEQGLLARQFGLASVKIADQLFAKNQKQLAETAYHTGSSLITISLGSLPEGDERSVYEILTQKNLLTGEDLKDSSMFTNASFVFSSLELSEPLSSSEVIEVWDTIRKESKKENVMKNTVSKDESSEEI